MGIGSRHMPQQGRPRLAVALAQVHVQGQVRHEGLPGIVVADQGREGMLAHQFDGGSNIIALELCWDVHGEHSESVIQDRSDRARLVGGQIIVQCRLRNGDLYWRQSMKESDPDNREQATFIYPFLAIMVVVICALIWRPRRLNRSR